MRRAVSAARTEDAPVQGLLRGHLGATARSLPVVSGGWPAREHVNIQVGLDAWLAAPGRCHELIGLTGFRHADFGLADLTQAGQSHSGLGIGIGIGIGIGATAARPSGPAGQSLACVQCGLYLIDDAGPAWRSCCAARKNVAPRKASAWKPPAPTRPRRSARWMTSSGSRSTAMSSAGTCSRSAARCSATAGARC
jgi:hypothetical protein